MNAKMIARLASEAARQLAEKQCTDIWSGMWPDSDVSAYDRIPDTAKAHGFDVSWYEAAGYAIGWLSTAVHGWHPDEIAEWIRYFNLDDVDAAGFREALELGQAHRRGRGLPAHGLGVLEGGGETTPVRAVELRVL